MCRLVILNKQVRFSAYYGIVQKIKTKTEFILISQRVVIYPSKSIYGMSFSKAVSPI